MLRFGSTRENVLQKWSQDHHAALHRQDNSGARPMHHDTVAKGGNSRLLSNHGTNNTACPQKPTVGHPRSTVQAVNTGGPTRKDGFKWTEAKRVRSGETDDQRCVKQARLTADTPVEEHNGKKRGQKSNPETASGQDAGPSCRTRKVTRRTQQETPQGVGNNRRTTGSHTLSHHVNSVGISEERTSHPPSDQGCLVSDAFQGLIVLRTSSARNLCGWYRLR